MLFSFIHLCTAILTVFFSRLIPTSLSIDDKATCRSTPLVSAKMYPMPMHHRSNISGGDYAYSFYCLFKSFFMHSQSALLLMASKMPTVAFLSMYSAIILPPFPQCGDTVHQLRHCHTSVPQMMIRHHC